ncbi:MAG: preprotein translocase subunit SecF [Candidatus Parcubacteria bacterium]|jgi:preprotein translocase subunit SecF|nr:preprotein translocase subunit SecF [Candidatus Parcubacteria bacterium]
MFIVNHRGFFFWVTGLLLVASVAALVIIPPKLSIEFTGGSLIEVAYTGERPAHEENAARVEALIGDASVRESGEKGLIVRTHTLTPAEHDALIGALSANGTYPLTELRFNSIGPSLGQELATKALYSILAVTLAIMLYIAWAFRKVSKPVPAWGYGIISVLMLAIDIIVPAGFFAVYAYFTGAQVDTLFVVALLALMGYCINDVIVIFDRVREHLKANIDNKLDEPFETTVGKSITETLGRSINTSLTVALALLAIVIFGSVSVRTFALVMLVGVVVGTFSSIARSAPLLIPVAAWAQKRAAGKAKKK